MGDCYYYKELNYSKGNYDASIDCTYVLIMDGSSREKQIKRQIEQSKLTSKVVFQYNYGYKNCDKRLDVDKPNYDLYHANITVFKHALANGYKRILLLEDDCEFDKRISNKKVISDINSFLLSDDPSIYNLGSSTFIVSPLSILTGSRHQRLLVTGDAHAVVYNEFYMKWICERSTLCYGHVDAVHNLHYSKFTYIFPLAFQKKTETYNAVNGWGFGYVVLDKILYKPFGIDRQVQPGYDQLKSVYDFVSLFVFFVSCYFLYRQFLLLRKNT